MLRAMCRTSSLASKYVDSRRLAGLGPLGQNLPCVVGHGILRRSIFSDESLFLTNFKLKREEAGSVLTERKAFKERLRKNFEEKGIQNIFVEDIKKLVDLASEEQDAFFLAKLLRAYLTSGRAVPDLNLHYSWFFSLCKSENFVNAAREVYNDPEVRRSRILEPSYHLTLRYYTLLYDNKVYDEIAEDLVAKASESFAFVTLAMAALYKIGTEDAYRRASSLFQEISAKSALGKPSVRSLRGFFIYSLFSYKMGEFGLAYDVLTTRKMAEIRANKYGNNLKLAILTETNRLEDALLLIKTVFLPHDSKTSFPTPICFEAMERLTLAVKVNENSSQVAKELVKLCSLLDSKADVINCSLEDMILEPVRTAPFSEARGAVNRRVVRESRGFHE